MSCWRSQNSRGTFPRKREIAEILKAEMYRMLEDQRIDSLELAYPDALQIDRQLSALRTVYVLSAVQRRALGMR